MTANRKKFFKIFLPFTLALLIVLAGMNACSDAAELSTGSIIPNFRLDNLEHERFYQQDNRDKITVLVFWATWCRSCKTEMAELQTIAGQESWKDVFAAAVCTDPENLADVKTIKRNLNITYPILLDRGGQLMRRFEIPALPATLIIGPDLKLQFYRVGFDRNLMAQIKSRVASLKGNK